MQPCFKVWFLGQRAQELRACISERARAELGSFNAMVVHSPTVARRGLRPVHGASCANTAAVAMRWLRWVVEGPGWWGWVHVKMIEI